MAVKPIKKKIINFNRKLISPLATKKAIILIVCLGLVVYANSLFNGFLMDDDGQILRNRLLDSFKNIPLVFVNSTFDVGGSISGLYYRPIMMLIFLFLNNLIGHTAFFYHLILVLFHITNAILIFLFLKYFFSKQLSLFLALIFLVHPINSEAVNYVSVFQDILFVFFGMLSLTILSKKNLSLKNTFLAILFIGLSLFSKETGALFIVVAILFQVMFKKGNWKSFGIYSFLTLLLYTFFRWIAVGLSVYKGSPMAKESFLNRIINIPQIIIYYLKTFIFPNTLATGYVWTIKEVNFHSVYLPLFILILFFSALFVFAYWLHKSRNTSFKTFLFFTLWFVLGLSLHLQLFPLSQTVADRWFYFPIIGILGIIGVFLKELNINWGKKTLHIYIALMLISILSFRTIYRNSDWRSGLTLAEKDIKTNPNSYMVTLTYGFELSKIGRLDEAQKQYEKTIELHPEWGMAWNNLGSIYLRKAKKSGDREFVKKSRNSFTKAMKYMPDTADTSYENMAILMQEYDEPAKIKEYLDGTLKKFPNNYKMWTILAVAELQLNNNIEAQIAAEKAVRINPTCAECVNVLRSLRFKQIN